MNFCEGLVILAICFQVEKDCVIPNWVCKNCSKIIFDFRYLVKTFYDSEEYFKATLSKKEEFVTEQHENSCQEKLQQCDNHIESIFNNDGKLFENYKFLLVVFVFISKSAICHWIFSNFIAINLLIRINYLWYCYNMNKLNLVVYDLFKGLTLINLLKLKIRTIKLQLKSKIH